MSREIVIQARGVTKSYPTPAGDFLALQNVSFHVSKGELMAVVGKSGSGKSTLLNLLAGIDLPTGGEVRVAGAAIQRLSEAELALWRGRNVGVVFQFFQLLPTLTILENVTLPMDFCKTLPKDERKARALALLEKVGIADQADKFPSALSGGQQQRAAIARALANDPPVIVADEPTGNLDSQTADSIFRLFRDLAGEGKTIVVVTHETNFSKYFHHSITLSDGKLAESLRPKWREHADITV